MKVILCRVVRENVKGGTQVGLNQRSDKQENVKELSCRLVREHNKGGTRLRLSKRSDKQRTRLVLHYKHALEEKKVIESRKVGFKIKGWSLKFPTEHVQEEHEKSCDAAF